MRLRHWVYAGPFILLTQGCVAEDLSSVSAQASTVAVDEGVERVARELPDPVTTDPDARAEAPSYYPIVLIHGFNASSNDGYGFYHVKKALLDDHHDVTVLEVPPFNSVEERANIAAQQIIPILDRFRKTHSDAKVNIVAHSMGGLDARRLLAMNDGWFAGKVASVTTIATPHRGTAIADWALSWMPTNAPLCENVLSSMAGWWAAEFSEQKNRTNLAKALWSLSVQRAPSFDFENPNVPGVFYQSFAGLSVTSPSQAPSSMHVAQTEACAGRVLGEKAVGQDGMQAAIEVFADHLGTHPSDGTVSVESAKGPADASNWHFRGCVRADHLDVVGQVHHTARDPITGFDHLRFYRNIARDIARINRAQTADPRRKASRAPLG
jgi:triacylglycerol lipase